MVNRGANKLKIGDLNSPDHPFVSALPRAPPRRLLNLYSLLTTAILAELPTSLVGHIGARDYDCDYGCVGVQALEGLRIRE